jgi:glycosyltransferase involved in cell wall biosynthesis
MVVLKVSVMVLTYNRSELLIETINSILNQTFKDFELLVIDNYSSDNTEKVVRSINDDRIKYFKNKNFGLLAVNRNFAIENSKGEFIAICDDDDLWLPDKLERQLKEFEKDDQIGLVCTNGFFFGNVSRNKMMGKPKDEYISFEKMIPKSEIINSSILVKKNVLEDIGKFDENPRIFTGEDYELWLRLVQKYKIKYIGVPLVKYRIHSGALQNEFLAGEKSINVAKEIYSGLLSKGIIDKKLYDKLLRTLNYEHMIIKLINKDKTLNFNKINHAKVNFTEKIRLVIFYSLSRMGLLNTLRAIIS